ncbi:hypothetical protein Skr01_15490 [Sphaerisporangium krabiense]|uniref:Uncharacterized protein n=1 Tax=Sphaerisporangium krabiense TaxID=763782 RepID=A0A7W8YZB5_9ACTN|nr:hypothetical protein [Sphaerisporangium krabiense]MBB5624582.1 hypothetical protein [Sphaerisporangium krabiense]GII61464.1 hypothetical protein Skr01_15490 [Sphaerisporangium krabiense]
MSSAKAGIVSVTNFVTAAQAAHTAQLAALANTAVANAAGVAGGKAGIAAGIAGVKAGGAGVAAGLGGQAGVTAAVTLFTPILATAAAVLVTYGAARLVGAGVDRLIDLGDRIELERGTTLAEQEAQELWADAVAAVAQRNARIAALSASLGPDDPDLPAPRRIAGSTVRQLADWCRATDQALAKAVPVVARRRRRAALDALRAAPPPGQDAVWEDPGRFAALWGDAARPAAPPASDPDHKVAAALAGLDPEATARDLAAVLRTAAAVRAHAGGPAAGAWLIELNDAIAQANRAVRDARRAAVYLGALDSPDDDHTALRDRLREVRDGRARLDEDLRAEADRALAAATRAREQRYALDLVRETLTGLGLDVDVTVSGTLRASHPDWRRHAVDIGVDPRMRMSATLRGPSGSPGPDPGHVAAWRETWRRAEGALTVAGVSAALVPEHEEEIREDVRAAVDQNTTQDTWQDAEGSAATHEPRRRSRP